MMTRQQWPVTEEMYKRYKKLLHKLAWGMSLKTGVEYEELMGEASLAFVKCMRTRGKQTPGKLSTLIQECVRNHLYDFTVKKNVNGTCTISMNELTDWETPTAPAPKLLIHQMGVEAKSLVHIACKYPDYNTREDIRSLAKMDGMTHAEINYGFADLDRVRRGG